MLVGKITKQSEESNRESPLFMGGVTTLFEGGLKRATEKKGIACRTKKDNEILSTQDADTQLYSYMILLASSFNFPFTQVCISLRSRKSHELRARSEHVNLKRNQQELQACSEHLTLFSAHSRSPCPAFLDRLRERQ